MITVVNKYKHKPTENDFYIGRGKLGNPYTHLDNTKARFRVSSREEAVEHYKIYINNILNGVVIENDEQNLLGNIFKQKYLEELQKIKNATEKQDIYLVCFCAPKSCHGDVIKEIIEKYIEEQKDFI